MDGSMFDSSVERGDPFTFILGRGQVIKGWDEGIAMLHKGETAKLIIPYQLAYGEGGRPPVIPPKATLIFDVQLVDIK
jgi:FKBP-type peptidyl-prolyl cis-trans isomerase